MLASENNNGWGVYDGFSIALRNKLETSCSPEKMNVAVGDGRRHQVTVFSLDNEKEIGWTLENDNMANNA